ncbi:PPE family protein [Nocardia sp. NBC_00565]|uniref:PPE domain-containing protein n=1 Tax=Nocardia sp. NBC_00565 TaxID=2975993 RepID=UPI002E8249CF|nr:PPE domain-containing protein [Nocardia sp. NBC_00565]WUC07667.1 PPE family protein [Nocardia sp. NBC_00565]
MPAPLPMFLAQTPEEIIGRLLGGPGIMPLMLTSAAYLAMAAQLNAAAANTDSSMTEMGGTYKGLSSDQAQAAFRNHAAWLNEQALVATQTAALAEQALNIYTSAQSAMGVVAIHLAAFRAREAASAFAIGTPAAPALLLQELEYLEIKVEATAVMVGYAAALAPTLAALPPPIEAPPIVTGGGGDFSPTSSYTAPESYNETTVRTPDSTTTNVTDTGTDNVNDPTDTTRPTTDPTDTPTDPTQTPGDTAQPPADADQALSPLDNAAGNSTMDGTGESPMDQQGFYGTSADSSTLAGLNGGVGSLVALGMVRGGLGSMPGASTGFRMPSNWLRGPGTAFGPASNPVSAGPGARGGPPRRAVAADARMRRRRRDEERKPGKVFVPGEQYEVPVLEKPPVIGVIEYTDHPEDSVADQEVLVGVIERADDDADSNIPVLPR